MLPHPLELRSDDVVEKPPSQGRVSNHHITSSAALPRLALCPPKGSPCLRELRTTSLNFVKPSASLSTTQLFARVPCACIEIFLRGPTAQLWEILKQYDDGLLIVTRLSFEELDTGNFITHLCLWRDGRFWMHSIIARSEQTSFSPTMIPGYKGDDSLGDSEACPQYQDISLAISEALLATPPRRAVASEKASNCSARKRKSEEADEIVSQACIPNQATRPRHKRSAAPHSPKLMMERPSSWVSGVTWDSTVGGADRYSLHLASLISPIRGAFAMEDPSNDHLRDASKCLAELLHHTESNDISMFPSTTETPSARKELYKQVWCELDGMVKQISKKTRGQEELAHAIAIAGADCSLVEERPPVPMTHQALLEKPTEFAPVNKRRRCEEVPRDPQGRPVFPIKLGPSLQVYDLGKIVWNRPNFHSEKYIWPSGYRSRRAYASMLNSENRIFYWCEIVDDGQAPEFRLTPEDDQNNPVVGISATAVWTVVVKRVGALRIEEGGKKTFANVSGPEYFGYANPTIARLIQQLPDAEKCTKYRRQEYLPNVPMRTVDTEVAQGAVVPEGSMSPLSRDLAFQRTPSHPHLAGDVGATLTVALLTAPARDDEGAAQPRYDGTPGGLEEPTSHSPGEEAGCEEEEVKPLSWLMEFRITKRLKEVGKFPKQFAGCSPGSLFNHYWSAKLRRLRTVELDGRQ